MSATLAVTAPRKFVASTYQRRFFDFVETGKGSALLKAVAGSGKSTSIVRALEYIPETATVIILAFNSPIAKEMKAKIVTLGEELGRSFRNVEAATFHARGFRALTRRFGKDAKVEVDAGKVRKILKDRLSEDEYELYGDFVSKLVGYAKGVGVGIEGLASDEVEVWREIIATQDMWLDSNDATEERAIDIARKALAASNYKAKNDLWIDFDDQLYLPLLWNLRQFGHDWVIVDEAQDTNPVRREFAKRLLKTGGRFIGVGDPRQSIYAFTGASTDAMDQLAAEFRTVELPLTVSYRCPKAIGELARTLVPYFEVAETAIEGSVTNLSLKTALERLGPEDAILCRKTAPLIALAFKIIASGRGCKVLGKDIGENLAGLVKKMRAKGIDNLLEKLNAYYAKELLKLQLTEADAKIEALSDRVEAIRTIVDSLDIPDRTIPGLFFKIDGLFGTGSEAVLTLATMHKSKGREWRRVAIYGPEYCPSKAAKTDEAIQQEMNLVYVAQTRAMEELIFVPSEEEARK